MYCIAFQLYHNLNATNTNEKKHTDEKQINFNITLGECNTKETAFLFNLLIESFISVLRFSHRTKNEYQELYRNNLNNTYKNDYMYKRNVEYNKFC